MESVMRLLVLSADRFNIDGQRLANVVCSSPGEDGEDHLGNQVAKMNCPYTLIDDLKLANVKLPTEVDLRVALIRAAQGKAGMEVRGLAQTKSGNGGKAAA